MRPGELDEVHVHGAEGRKSPHRYISISKHPIWYIFLFIFYPAAALIDLFLFYFIFKLIDAPNPWMLSVYVLWKTLTIWLNPSQRLPQRQIKQRGQILSGESFSIEFPLPPSAFASILSILTVAAARLISEGVRYK